MVVSCVYLKVRNFREIKFRESGEIYFLREFNFANFANRSSSYFFKIKITMDRLTDREVKRFSFHDCWTQAKQKEKTKIWFNLFSPLDCKLFLPKTSFLGGSAIREKSNFSREFNFANYEKSDFSPEFNFANSRQIREIREIFFPRIYMFTFLKGVYYLQSPTYVITGIIPQVMSKQVATGDLRYIFF